MGLGLPTGVTTQSMLTGLTNLNIGDLNLSNGTANIVTLNGAANSNEIQSMITAVHNNEAAAKIADQLTTKLVDQGILKQGQQVVGFQDGKIFVTSGTKAAVGAGGNLGAPMIGAGANAGGSANAGANANVNVGSLLTGLKKLDLQSFTVQATNVVNVNDALKAEQVKGLMEAINVNADARKVADQLTQQLMASGTIKEGQHVIGVIGDKVYITGEAK